MMRTSCLQSLKSQFLQASSRLASTPLSAHLAAHCWVRVSQQPVETREALPTLSADPPASRRQLPQRGTTQRHIFQEGTVHAERFKQRVHNQQLLLFLQALLLLLLLLFWCFRMQPGEQALRVQLPQHAEQLPGGGLVAVVYAQLVLRWQGRQGDPLCL